MEWLPGLSVAMLVREPPAQVAAMASLFSEVADEIVICVDSRVDEDLLWPLYPVATRLLRVKHSHPFFNTTQWFHDVARHQWVFHIDGDEVPSQALVRWLGTVRSFEDRATHAYVERRWLWPDSSQYLVAEPWRQDPQLRLSPRESRLMGWRPGLHDTVEVVGPGIMRPEWLYHLDLIERTIDERYEKVERYDQLTSDVLPGFSQTINRAYYLPEERQQHLATKTVPDEDRKIIETVIEAGRRPAVRKTARFIPIVDAQEVLKGQRGLLGEPVDLRVSLEIPTHELRCGPGQAMRIFVQVTNTGSRPLPLYDGTSGVAVGWTFGESGTPDDGRSSLSIQLREGETVNVPCVVTAPTTAGTYVLRFGVVDEGKQWLDAETSCQVEVVLEQPVYR